MKTPIFPCARSLYKTAFTTALPGAFTSALTVALVVAVGLPALAQSRARKSTSSVAPRSPSPSSRSSSSSLSQNDPLMIKARSLASGGQYQEASKLLYQMSRLPKYARESAQIKYILGLMLYEMRLYQSAAFVFYDVVRQESKDNPHSKYLRQSLEKLALAADSLNSDVLLRFAIKQIDPDQFPASNRDMMYFRTGEVKLGEKDYAAATREFVKVRSSSRYYLRARYKLALALSEANELDKALTAFEDLVEQTKNRGVTDPTRVSALLGRARVLYQKHQFELAYEAYREIPRDTEQWHEALFESTWSMLRDGRFRSALSNFHSLHSAFFEDYYQPESLFLRSIVYLYICKYDEMEKTIGLFEKQYAPVQRNVNDLLASLDNPIDIYKEFVRIENEEISGRKTHKFNRLGYKLPAIVARQISKEGDVRRTFSYLENLETERGRIYAMPGQWKSSGIGQFVNRVIEARTQSTRNFAGRLIRHHLQVVQSELKDLFEQAGFLHFEMLSSKKESLRKQIAGKGLEKQRVDEDTGRSYYIQNGYDYWPFKGEYWLDELGNYQYVGVKACD